MDTFSTGRWTAARLWWGGGMVAGAWVGSWIDTGWRGPALVTAIVVASEACRWLAGKVFEAVERRRAGGAP